MPSATACQEPFDYFFYDDRIDYQRVSQILRSIAGILPPFAEDILRFIADASTRFGRTYARIKHKDFYEGFCGSTEGFGGTMPPPPHSEKTRYTTLALLDRLGLVTRDGEIYSIHLNRINPVDLLADDEIRKGFVNRNRHNPKLRSIEGVAEWASQRLLSILRMTSGTQFSQNDGKCKPSGNAPASAEAKTSRQKSKNCLKHAQTAKRSSATAKKGCFSGQQTGTIGCTKTEGQSGSFLSLILSFLQGNSDLPYSFLSIIDIQFPDKSGNNLGEAILGEVMGKRTIDQIKNDAMSGVSKKQEKVRSREKSRGTLADRMRAFERSWGDGQRETFGGIPTRIDQRGKRNIKDMVLKAASPGFDTADFAHWVAKHWQAIGAQYFQHSKNYPVRPVIPWFVKCLETYTQAYEAREYLDESGVKSGVSIAQKVSQELKHAEKDRESLQSIAAELKMQKAETRELQRKLREATSGGKSKRKRGKVSRTKFANFDDF